MAVTIDITPEQVRRRLKLNSNQTGVKDQDLLDVPFIPSAKEWATQIISNSSETVSGLGSKTTLVKAVVKALGINDEVTSPTFSLQQCYGDSIYHYDIYNHGLEHFISLGMLEELDKEGLHFVEWGDDELVNILSASGIPTVVIEIEKVSDDEREYKVDYAYA